MNREGKGQRGKGEAFSSGRNKTSRQFPSTFKTEINFRILCIAEEEGKGREAKTKKKKKKLRAPRVEGTFAAGSG